ncbi:MAG: hypothetical protein WBA89_00825 [Microcoleus sp.]|uniref:hypothetical protein n=1 Tax=Microcoleus sp. TaxID=44472 RepID=UPI003C76DAC5
MLFIQQKHNLYHFESMTACLSWQGWLGQLTIARRRARSPCKSPIAPVPRPGIPQIS